MRRRRRVQEHVHHERWMVSYADFVTLLFALFVVLFASSQHDKRTFRAVSEAVKNGFQDLQGFDNTPASSRPAGAELQHSGSAGLTRSNPSPDRSEFQARLRKALGGEIEKKQIVMNTTSDGLVISLHELGFFRSGQADLLPGAALTIQHIADVLMQYGLTVRVEGHSDNVPIHNATFNSNWELSTARANAVAKILLSNPQFDPKRLAIAGYAEYHPAESNETVEGRRTNRRVDLVMVSSPFSSTMPLP